MSHFKKIVSIALSGSVLLGGGYLVKRRHTLIKEHIKDLEQKIKPEGGTK